MSKKKITIEMIEAVVFMADYNYCTDCGNCPTMRCVYKDTHWRSWGNMSTEATKWLEENKEEIAIIRGEHEKTDLSNNEFDSITISKTEYNGLKEKAEMFDRFIEITKKYILENEELER